MLSLGLAGTRVGGRNRALIVAACGKNGSYRDSACGWRVREDADENPGTEWAPRKIRGMEAAVTLE